MLKVYLYNLLFLIMIHTDPYACNYSLSSDATNQMFLVWGSLHLIWNNNPPFFLACFVLFLVFINPEAVFLLSNSLH